ncbi:MAG: DDE transposase, partial [Chloroflexota bacterium]|nr:DDE transposase [Chloroflexota bacterium]
VADAVRIKLEEDRRIFTPVARSSYDWQDYYDERSAVERVNSRLAGGYGFDHPFIRGLTKMRLRMTMGLTIMLAMALGRIQAGQPENLRSLVRPA